MCLIMTCRSTRWRWLSNDNAQPGMEHVRMSGSTRRVYWKRAGRSAMLPDPLWNVVTA